MTNLWLNERRAKKNTQWPNLPVARLKGGERKKHLGVLKALQQRRKSAVADSRMQEGSEKRGQNVGKRKAGLTSYAAASQAREGKRNLLIDRILDMLERIATPHLSSRMQDIKKGFLSSGRYDGSRYCREEFYRMIYMRWLALILIALFMNCDALQKADAAIATTQLNASVFVVQSGDGRYGAANGNQPEGSYQNWTNTIPTLSVPPKSDIHGSFGYPPAAPSR